MKVYVISKGLYYAGDSEWVRNKSHAFEFVDNYGRSYALTHAIRTAEILRSDRRNPRPDAKPIRFLDDPIPARPVRS